MKIKENEKKMWLRTGQVDKPLSFMRTKMDKSYLKKNSIMC